MATIKKIILLGLTALIVAACGHKQQKYKIYYKVYYPNNTKSYCAIIDDEPYLGSDRGTNYLRVGSITGPSIIKTSAPIELAKTVKLKEK